MENLNILQFLALPEETNVVHFSLFGIHRFAILPVLQKKNHDDDDVERETKGYESKERT